MNAQLIERHFAKIGARAAVHANANRRAAEGVSIDIAHDVEGEYFDIAVPPRSLSDVKVIDTRPRLRHLLLMSQHDGAKHKFLCGHDERHWFVAAAPEGRSVSSVQTAFEALKPPVVKHRQDQLKVKSRKRNRRRNEAFVRQGEWFFVPVGDLYQPDPRTILRNEPISRSGGKPHICEQLVRQGGELVYVSTQHPGGLTESQYIRLIGRRPKLRNLHWVTQRRNPLVFVRGKIRHSDHKTLVLNEWRRVVMNTETESVAMRHVMFID